MTVTPFRKKPPLELLERILETFNVSIHQLPTQFSSYSYRWSDDHLIELIPYYIPSMVQRFFDNDYPINTVTIIRHLLKEHNFELKRCEVMHDYRKKNVYHIYKKKEEQLTSDIILKFD